MDTLNLNAVENKDGELHTIKISTEDKKNSMFVVADHQDDILTIEISGADDLVMYSKKTPVKLLMWATRAFLSSIHQQHPINEMQIALALSDFMSRTKFLLDDELKDFEKSIKEAGLTL